MYKAKVTHVDDSGVVNVEFTNGKKVQVERYNGFAKEADLTTYIRARAEYLTAHDIKPE